MINWDKPTFPNLTKKNLFFCILLEQRDNDDGILLSLLWFEELFQIPEAVLNIIIQTPVPDNPLDNRLSQCGSRWLTHRRAPCEAALTPAGPLTASWTLHKHLLGSEIVF